MKNRDVSPYTLLVKFAFYQIQKRIYENTRSSPKKSMKNPYISSLLNWFSVNSITLFQYKCKYFPQISKRKKRNLIRLRFFMVYPIGFEPTAPSVGGLCSIQLSYGYASIKMPFYFTIFPRRLQAFQGQFQILLKYFPFTLFSLSFFALLCYNGQEYDKKRR